MSESLQPPAPGEASAVNRAAYDRIAGRFAERNAATLPYISEAAGRLLEALGPDPRRPILDLGCGFGRDMAWFEARSARLIGADLSAGMLAEARQRARGPLCQLDMSCLPFRAGSFAAIWCQATLLHLPKAAAPAALAEAWRVLAPGGLLHASVQRGEGEGYETRPYEPAVRYYAHYHPDEFHALVRTAGFTITWQGSFDGRRSWIWVAGQKT